jgi:hypothetical protein
MQRSATRKPSSVPASGFRGARRRGVGAGGEAVDHQLRHVVLHEAVGDHELHRLTIRERRAEGDALP